MNSLDRISRDLEVIAKYANQPELGQISQGSYEGSMLKPIMDSSFSNRDKEILANKSLDEYTSKSVPWVNQALNSRYTKYILNYLGLSRDPNESLGAGKMMNLASDPNMQRPSLPYYAQWKNRIYGNNRANY